MSSTLLIDDDKITTTTLRNSFDDTRPNLLYIVRKSSNEKYYADCTNLSSGLMGIGNTEKEAIDDLYDTLKVFLLPRLLENFNFSPQFHIWVSDYHSRDVLKFLSNEGYLENKTTKTKIKLVHHTTLDVKIIHLDIFYDDIAIKRLLPEDLLKKFLLS